MTKQEKKSKLIKFITVITAFIVAITTLITAIDKFDLFNQDDQPDKVIVTTDSSESSERIRDLENALAEMKEEKIREREKELKNEISHLKRELEKKSETNIDSGVSNNESINYDLSGYWTLKDNPTIQYSITQYGSSIAIEEYSSMYGMPIITASGQGVISNSSLEINYSTILSNTGQINLRIVNQNRLVGTIHDYFSGVSNNFEVYR